MNKIQKILNEVERLQSELITEKKKGNGSDVDDSCILTLQNIKNYIKFVQEEPVSEDLEEAAKERVDAEDYCCVDEDGMPLYDSDYLEYMFKEGANWQKHQDDLIIKQTKTCYRLLGKQQMKEEMMKDAVNMTVGYWMPNGLRLDVDETENDWGLDEGDKVKVIVIKEG